MAGKRLRVALTGIGGYGVVHVEAAARLAEEGLVEVTAFAERNESVPAIKTLAAGGARGYQDFGEMLAAEKDLDVVCIATPIPFHYSMAMAAFERGVHVFLEKPPVVRIQDLRALFAARKKAGVHCAVGFNGVARPMVTTLKQRLCSGAIGHVRSVYGEARWLRADSYYQRSGWAGKTRLGEAFVLDGPLNNACAHVLNMALFLAGATPDGFACPVRVQGELYRGNVLANEDTSCLRAQVDTGVEVCVHVTQCAAQSHPRSWTVVGDSGVARLHDKDGVDLPGEHIAPLEDEEHDTLKTLRRLVERVRGGEAALIMPLEESEWHLLLSNGAYESSGCVRPIPAAFVRREAVGDSVATVVSDIDAVMFDAAMSGKLLSEMGLPWTTGTEPYDLSGYSEFPVRWQDTKQVSEPGR